MDDQQRISEIWALADDENLRDLLVWRRVKERTEHGGFNGLLASDFRHVDDALSTLLKDLPS